MTTKVYFDLSDNDMDGCGWNVVTGDEAYAWRFTTEQEAIAFCERNNLTIERDKVN